MASPPGGFQVKRDSKLRYRERLTPESYSRHVAALAGDRYLETVPIHLREDVRRAFVGEASKLCGPGPTLKDCATVIFAVKSDGWTTGAWS